MEMLYFFIGLGFSFVWFFIFRGDNKITRYRDYRHKNGIGFFKGLFHYREWKRRDNEEHLVYMENGFGYVNMKRKFSVALFIDGNGVRYSRIVNGEDYDKHHTDAKAYRYAWAKFGIAAYKPRSNSSAKPDMLDSVKTALNFLGLSGSVTEQQIKTAYRTLSMKYHPDHGGAVADFVKLGKARDTALAHIALKRK